MHAKLWCVDQVRDELGTGSRLVGLLLTGTAAAAASAAQQNNQQQNQLQGEKYLDTLRRVRALKAHRILRCMPWSVSFKDRLLLFQHILTEMRVVTQDNNNVNSAVKVRVKRSSIFQDAKARLNQPGLLQKRIYVIFVNPLTGKTIAVVLFGKR
jgi:hypothetical protein